MAYNENLADRVRDVLVDEVGLREQKMFGGLAFMLDAHMCCGVAGDELTLRFGPEGVDAARTRCNVRPMDFAGRPLATMVFVEPGGLRGSALGRWVEQAADASVRAGIRGARI